MRTELEKNRALIVVRASVYLTAFIAFWILLAIFIRGFDSMLGIVVPEIFMPTGCLLILLGAVLGLHSVFIFVSQGHGTPVPFDPPKHFVVTGFYRYVRNPMFIGGFLALLGYGMFLLSISTVLLAFIALSIAHVYVLFFEEPGLERRFGDSYRTYKQVVYRWIPKI